MEHLPDHPNTSSAPRTTSRDRFELVLAEDFQEDVHMELPLPRNRQRVKQQKGFSLWILVVAVVLVLLGGIGPVLFIGGNPFRRNKSSNNNNNSVYLVSSATNNNDNNNVSQPVLQPNHNSTSVEETEEDPARTTETPTERPKLTLSPEAEETVIAVETPAADEAAIIPPMATANPPPTHAPVSLPEAPPPLAQPGCLVALACLEDVAYQNTRDRLTHNAPVYKGQALCNSDDAKFPGVLFQFGLTMEGTLVWQSCHATDPEQSELRLLGGESATDLSELPPDKVWFQMTPEATWQIWASAEGAEDPKVVWEHRVENRPRPVQVTPRCLSDRPVLDCPYLHFRRHGEVIMNFVDATDGWVACKSHKICYSELWNSE